MDLTTNATPAVERPARPTPPKKWTAEDFAPVFAGEVELPHAEATDPGRFLNDLAARGHMMTPQWGYSLRNEGRDTGRKQWTQFFTIGHIYAGTGYAVIYGGDTAIVMKFALCKHEKVVGSGANPSRGRNPGYCKHCGMDMSVDSSD